MANEKHRHSEEEEEARTKEEESARRQVEARRKEEDARERQADARHEEEKWRREAHESGREEHRQARRGVAAAVRRKQERQHEAEALLVDLGRRSKGDVDRLRKGRGPLIDEVEDCLEELRAAGDLPGSAQPLVVVVKERRSLRAPLPPFLMPPFFPFGMGGEEDDDDDDD
jgi:hypothetical protein